MQHELQRCALITRWGTVVTRGDTPGTLKQAPINASTPLEDCFPVYSDALRLKTDIEGIGPFILETEAGHTYLKARDGYLTAHEDGSVRLFQELKNPWEQFLVLTRQEFERFYFFVTNSWIDEDGHIIRPSDIESLEYMRLRVGENFFNIAETFINNSDGLVCRTRGDYISDMVVWNDLWMPHRYRLYRPLVYLCAFGIRYLDTLDLCLRSLSEFGKHTGDILIVSDLDEETLKEHCPATALFNCHVWTLHGQAGLDFYTARFRIAQWKPIYQFSPLLYMDTDVVVDNDLNGLFEDIFRSDKMSAQKEFFTRLQTSPSIGSQLFEKDERCHSRDLNVPGFNSGILSIPRIEEFDFVLNMIQSCIYRFSEKVQNRHELSHFDQSIANYIAVLTQSFDLDFLTEKVSYYATGAIRSNDFHTPEREQMNYTGFVHFWGTGERIEAMSTYMQSIRDHVPFEGWTVATPEDVEDETAAGEGDFAGGLITQNAASEQEAAQD
ncbi:glycosyltransferase family protein [Gluconobacter kanchanaburiensis]|nr:hypothetical protein [Gluconobacter kanchanaburiensis]MBF0861621.1 hypothetical protein [Gluconobacter kanchanaburiensis]